MSIHALLCCAVFIVCLSNSTNAQFLSIGGYVYGKAGLNFLNTSITRSEFMIVNAPEIGVSSALRLVKSGEAFAFVDIGYTPYAARSVSNDPFTGKALTDFQMSAQLQYLSVGLGFRYKHIASLSAHIGFPLGAAYTANAPVFEAEKDGDTTTQFSSLRSYSLSAERLRTSTEIRAEAMIVSFPLGLAGYDGTLSINVMGSFVMNALVIRLPQTGIPGHYNIIGKDPLAGLRTLNIQPVSLGIGLRYVLGVME